MNIPGNTLEELRRNYRRLAQIYHPDKPTGSEEKFKELARVYEQRKKEIEDPSAYYYEQMRSIFYEEIERRRQEVLQEALRVRQEEALAKEKKKRFWKFIRGALFAFSIFLIIRYTLLFYTV